MPRASRLEGGKIEFIPICAEQRTYSASRNVLSHVFVTVTYPGMLASVRETDREEYSDIGFAEGLRPVPRQIDTLARTQRCKYRRNYFEYLLTWCFTVSCKNLKLKTRLGTTKIPN